MIATCFFVTMRAGGGGGGAADEASTTALVGEGELTIVVVIVIVAPFNGKRASGGGVDAAAVAAGALLVAVRAPRFSAIRFTITVQLSSSTTDVAAPLSERGATSAIGFAAETAATALVESRRAPAPAIA